MSKTKTATKAALNKKLNLDDDQTIEYYRCTRCGKKHQSPVQNFFMSKTSPLYVANNLYSQICIHCVNDLFFTMQARYKDTKLALMIICSFLDIYFSEKLYEQIKDNANFSFGNYAKLLNGVQYKSKSFTTSLMEILNRGGFQGSQEIQKEIEEKWSKPDLETKQNVINVVGYDPFEGYPETDRKFLFNELIKYFDEDISDDTYKLSQVIQLVNNNNQIRRYDLQISTMNPVNEADSIKVLNNIKKDLVASNDKIAKENEISVKNRSNKDIGKSTLTYLMRDLRQKDFEKAESDYYDQLKSAGTFWAMEMSDKAIQNNGMFDENDKQEIFHIQRELIQGLQKNLDDEKEKTRLLTQQIDVLSKLKVEVDV